MDCKDASLYLSYKIVVPFHFSTHARNSLPNNILKTLIDPLEEHLSRLANHMFSAPFLISLYVSISYVAAIHMWSQPIGQFQARRDDPRVIKSRMRRVGLITSINLLLVPWLQSTFSAREITFMDAFLALGIIPAGYKSDTFYFDVSNFVYDIVRALKLVCILYSGPLLDNVLYYLLVPDVAVTEAFQDLKAELCSIWGLRNYVFGPATEELFYTCMLVNNFLLTSTDPVTYKAILLLPPLFFGLAHLHHAWEMSTVGIYSNVQIAITTLIQMTYTTLFGVFTNFVYLRTGQNFWCCFAIHAFANYMGLPKMSALCEQFDLNRSTGFRSLVSKFWKWGYVAMLLIGLVKFKGNMWELTDSRHAIQL